MKITKSTTLIEALNAAGISRSEMGHYCSDLYVFVTPITTAVINEWFEVQGLAKDLQDGKCTMWHFNIIRRRIKHGKHMLNSNTVYRRRGCS